MSSTNRRRRFVDVDFVQDERETAMTRVVTVDGDLDPQQRARLADTVTAARGALRYIV